MPSMTKVHIYHWWETHCHQPIFNATTTIVSSFDLLAFQQNKNDLDGRKVTPPALVAVLLNIKRERDLIHTRTCSIPSPHIDLYWTYWSMIILIILIIPIIFIECYIRIILLFHDLLNIKRGRDHTRTCPIPLKPQSALAFSPTCY